MSCNTLPVLGDAPLISASLQYLRGLDENSLDRLLARRTNSVLGQWGDNIYLADGSDTAQIILDNLSVDLQTETLEGLVVRRESGRIMLFKNNSAVEMIPVLVNGILTLQNKANCINQGVSLSSHLLTLRDSLLKTGCCANSALDPW